MEEKDTIRFECPRCGKSLRAAASAAGKRALCSNKSCGQPVAVPGASKRSAARNPRSKSDPTPANDPASMSDGLRAVYAYDPDPNPFAYLLFGLLFVLPLLAMVGVPWLLFELDLYETHYMVPILLGFPLFSAGVYGVWRWRYKHVPAVELLPQLLSESHGSGTDVASQTAARIREIGQVIYWTGGDALMREAYEVVRDDRLKEAWTGFGGWPDSWADVYVDELVKLLKEDARDPSTEGGFGHKKRIHVIGEAINGFGGIELMRKTYHRVRQTGVYFSQQIWHDIGEWRE